MEQETRTKEWVVYAGPRAASGGSFLYLYYRLDNLDLNDGKTGVKKLKEFNASKKLFTTGSIGAIFEAEFEKDTIYFSKKTLPLGFWKNDDQRTEWRAHEIACAEAKTLKGNIQTNTLIETLQPIKRAYNESTIDGQRALLAEVLRILTSRYL